MENHADRVLTLSLSWSAGAKAHRVAVPLGPLLRAAAVAGLCALSYAFGVFNGRVQRQDSAAPPPMTDVRVSPIKLDGLLTDEREPVITPLKAMDPSSLVMGVGAQAPPAAKAPPPPPPLKSWRDELRQSQPK